MRPRRSSKVAKVRQSAEDSSSGFNLFAGEGLSMTSGEEDRYLVIGCSAGTSEIFTAVGKLVTV